MNNLHNTLEDTREETAETVKQLNKLNDTQIKKAVSDAIFKVFPKKLAEINKILEQYEKATKSDILAKFEYFDFEELEDKMTILEEIDTMTKHLALGAKEVTNSILYQKNEMEKTGKNWLEKIEKKGIKNLNAEKVIGREIDALNEKLEDIKKSKNDIFSLNNMLIVVIGVFTAMNTYKLYF